MALKGHSIKTRIATLAKLYFYSLSIILTLKGHSIKTRIRPPKKRRGSFVRMENARTAPIFVLCCTHFTRETQIPVKWVQLFRFSVRIPFQSVRVRMVFARTRRRGVVCYVTSGGDSHADHSWHDSHRYRRGNRRLSRSLPAAFRPCSAVPVHPPAPDKGR